MSTDSDESDVIPECIQSVNFLYLSSFIIVKLINLETKQLYEHNIMLQEYYFKVPITNIFRSAQFNAVGWLWELQKQYKGRGRILPCRCDMSKESDIEQLMDFAKKNANGIDVLVNNAAVLPPGTVTDVTGEGTDMKVIEECYKTNVIGVIKATKLAAADMVARNVKGHIFVINSIVGHKTVNVGKLAKSSVYGSTKRAITELVENIRLEFSYTATPIKITSISPGAVDTAMLASVPGLMSGIPMLKGKEVAQALVLVLSTPESVNISELTIQAVGEYM